VRGVATAHRRGAAAEARELVLHRPRLVPRTKDHTTVSERLLLDFDAFFLEHRLCGELRAGVDGLIVWIVCDCGARMARVDEANRD
jgi:hypothetical protein